MGKWNCRICGLYLEDKRNLAEFPLEDDAAAIFCRDCAKTIKSITCRQCKHKVQLSKSIGGKFCNRVCERAYMTHEMEVRE